MIVFRFFAGWSTGQWVLRGVIVAGYLVAQLSSAWVPGAGLPGWFLLVLGVLFAAGAGLAPDSTAGGLAAASVLLTWAYAARHDPVAAVGLPAVIAVGGLMCGHVGAVLAASVPVQAAPDRALIVLWLRRGLLVVLPSVLVLLVLRTLGGSVDGAHWVWVLAAVVVAVLAGAVTVVTRSLRR